MAEDFERMIGRREDDPVLVNRQAGDEDREVKIDPGETGQAERDAEKVESVPRGNIERGAGLSRRFSRR